MKVHHLFNGYMFSLFNKHVRTFAVQPCRKGHVVLRIDVRLIRLIDLPNCHFGLILLARLTCAPAWPANVNKTLWTPTTGIGLSRNDVQ